MGGETPVETYHQKGRGAGSADGGIGLLDFSDLFERRCQRLFDENMLARR